MPITIIETTVQDVAGQSVAASNIYERQLPDADGVVGPRISAMLTMWQTGDAEPRRQVVVPGSVVNVGGEEWQVVRVEYESAEPGARSAMGARGAVVLDKIGIRGRPDGAATELPR